MDEKFCPVIAHKEPRVIRHSYRRTIGQSGVDRQSGIKTKRRQALIILNPVTEVSSIASRFLSPLI
jgi:hypothetical protein